MKKTFFYTLAFVLSLFLIFRYAGKYALEWIVETKYTFTTELPRSKIFVHNDLELDPYELNSLQNMIELSIGKVDSIFPNDLFKVKVYISTGNSSATANPGLNKITLYNSEYCYAPFCHEYIHVVLGVHKELWFAEGLATFIGQNIRSKSGDLLKYCDGDEKYLIGEKTLTGGKLSNVPELKRKYSADDIKAFVLNTKSFNDLAKENKHEFYFFSASFCKYLFEVLGEEDMLDMIGKIKDSHNSIIKEFEERNIELDELMNSWLSEY